MSRLGGGPSAERSTLTPSLRVVAFVLGLAVVAIAVLAAGLQFLGPGPSGFEEQPDPLVWPGPIRPELGRLPEQRGSSWDEGRDAQVGAIDIARVATDSPEQPHWRITLAEKPPRAAGLDPALTVISYGLVFETTGDGVGDYVVGINNDGPKPGQYRIWVTDVATGKTDEQIGPPYGFPIEFSHPDEAEPGPIQPGQPVDVGLVFTFLGASAPPGVTATSPFYAWAALRAGDEVVAWDYAPDASWLVPQGPGG